ncbi:MAG: peptidase C13 [Sphingomonadaceae bacterium]|nr:peptidase C13 [Sphingomonadaceae bacterium]
MVPGASASAQETIDHSLPPPPFLDRMQPFEAVQAANAGLQIEVDRLAAEQLADHRALGELLAGIAPQRPGTVDAYVLVIALDSDPVFAREARQAAIVLERRYDAAGRSIMLAGPDGQAIGGLPRPTARGTPASLSIALAHIAATMDVEEDVLVLFTTSHGTPNGLYYHYGDQGFGGLSPSRLRGIFDELGIENRLVIVNACFSGIFVSGLSSDSSAIVSAASAGLTSFGCSPGNDWTFFGDAFVNRALRQPQPLGAAFEAARELVGQWEDEQGLPASQPKFSIGRGAIGWLSELESRMPRIATPPVGRSPAEEN